jgi:hypothetical protein
MDSPPYHEPLYVSQLWSPISSPKLNRWGLRERRSAVLIQLRLKGSARKNGLLLLMNSKESEADESSVSSLTTSESIWENPLPEDVTILSTVDVAKIAIKSNQVTRSSPRQRQAKRTTVESPTSSVFSPIEKRRLHVEESSEVVIAITERKVCRPEDLYEKNGFKLSVFYTDQPCQVRNCKDPACVFGHICKCSIHMKIGAVLKGECFSLFKNGDCTKSCLRKSKQGKIDAQRKAEVTSTDSFAFFEARTNSFINSSSHSWNKKPTPAESEVFMYQVVIFHATNPDTPFIVSETSFSDLRNKTEKELKTMLEVLKKRFIKEYPDGKGIKCFYSGLEVVPLTHAGSEMLSFDQGNPSLKSDAPGQTWIISSWFMNKYKNDMSSVAFKEHMNYICENYDPEAADAMYERYNGREDVQETTASRLFALSRFARQTFDNIRSKEKETKNRILCEYASADHVRQHARKMGSICLVMGTPFKEGVFGLSLDRSLDDMHHRPEDCLLIGTRLNDAKAAHAAFRTQEALAQHCRENGNDESATNHAKMCVVLRPIIKGMIQRWTKIEAVI